MTFELISTDPCTGAVVWRGPVGNVDAEVATVAENWSIWASRPLTVRVETIRRFANVVRARATEFALLIARETGKPLWEARAEVDSVIARVEISIAAYSERTPQRRLQGAMGQRTAVRHKPHGVLAVIGPFNFPAQVPNSHICPALIAGNGIVFKPSEKTPACGDFLVDCYHQAGVPSGAIRLLIGGPDEGRALAAHRHVDGLLFTGSARTGLALNRLFADTPHRILALELGGNNPLVAWDPADIHTAAAMIVQSAFSTAGQRCTAARRLIVRDGSHEALLREVVKLADRLIVGAPQDKPAPFIGPVIDNAAADAVQEAFLDLVLKGGRPLRHLVRPDPDRPFLSPAIIDVTDVADRPDEEIFGPVLQVIRVPDFDMALAEANHTRFGLTAALIGGSPELYDRFWATIRAGVINWNRPTIGTPAGAPFGGLGLSGNHRPSAWFAADYCAYPVVSSETEHPRATIGIGLKDAG